MPSLHFAFMRALFKFFFICLITVSAGNTVAASSASEGEMLPFIASPMATPEQQHTEQKVLKIIASPEVLQSRSKARNLMEAHPIAKTSGGQARLDYALDKWVVQLALQVVGRDLSNPHFIWTTGLAEYEWMGHTFPGSGAGIDCTDNIYRNAGLDGAAAYEVVGQLSANPPAQFSFHLTNHPEDKGFDTTSDMTDVGGYEMITNDTMVIEPDGTFRLTLDASPANGRSNHIQMVEGKALYLLVRDTLSNWKQIPNHLTIRHVGGGALPKAQTEQQLIERTANYLEAFVAFWLQFNDHFHSPAPNTLGQAYARTGGLGYTAAGRFKLRDDEVFLITVADGDADYAGMQVTDLWMIGPSPLLHLSNYNLSQAVANADGTRTYLIAAKDPGYGNWVDTASLHEGWILFRWQGVAADLDGTKLVVEQKLLRLSELPDALPEGVSKVSTQQRDQQLQERIADWGLRIATGK